MFETCQVLIIYRLDYRNALLYTIPLFLTNRLKRVENYAAHLVIRTRKREHRTPILFQLHWLPLRFRSLYKILFYTFNVLSETPLFCLSDLIYKYIPLRMLRSDSYSICRVPITHTTVYPRLWNKLRNHIKLAASKDIIGKVLKIHLFKYAYL